MFTTIVISSLLATAYGQLPGTLTPEVHPSLTWQQCTSLNDCSTKQGKVVLDANWRWIHQKNGYINCYTGNSWNVTACADNKSCAANCEVEGADYQGTYGVSTSGNAVSLNYVTRGASSTVFNSRLFLMDTDTTYQVFDLTNQELAFDVDASSLPCGLKGALYFVQMDKDGGMSKYPGNKAGAKYGTGYCDGQCTRNLKFINGEANMEGWVPSEYDRDNGEGAYGSCCTEVAILEANSVSAAITPRPCSVDSQWRCAQINCGAPYDEDTVYAGPCDKVGCDYNSYRMGAPSFYGKGKTVDTSSKFTVITQFSGIGANLEIIRFYIQKGKIIPNSQSTISGVSGNSLTNKFCDAQKTVFGDRNEFANKGGIARISNAMSKGMVLTLSVSNDYWANMLWLDSSYPPDADPSRPGVRRGECPYSPQIPGDDPVEGGPPAKVTFSNIRFGPIGSTYSVI